MADEREHQEELSQESPVNHPEASTSGTNSQIANLTPLVEELTRKHTTQQSQMESISAENQVLKNQLMAINTQAAYSYYYNPYAEYSAGASAGGWQQTTPYYPQGARNTAHSLVAPMQPLRTTPARRSTPDLPATLECPIPPGTMNVEEMMRSFMSEEMRTFEAQMEQRFSSKIHRATTTTPRFDDLARGVRETPLTKCITNTITPKFRSISSPRFDGMSDPHDHLLQYKHVVQSTNIPTGMLDDMMCKLFAQSLKGAALRWFCNLPPESIDSFDELSLEFMRSYSVHIQSGKTTKDLWGVVQGPHESLRAYVKHFSRAISEISRLDDETAKEALKKGLRHRSLFKNEICASPSELVGHLKCQDFVTWPKKLSENPASDTTKYCEFHKDHGHQTIDCRVLRAEVAELLKKGHLREFLTEKGIETYGLGNESKERRIVQQIEDTLSPPPVQKTIGVICRGSIYSGETVTAIKSHRRKATQPIATILSDDPIEHLITFHSSEATSLSLPHDDALVLTLNVSNCEIGRILVDNGSSADVLFSQP
ncbi:hypothetical protein TIFTF001_024046 [Ficus carica]|uniref:Retrotransposon gag domain-containing protein n=1 Tax=Ficus carica TaxID=3494 RepID=A0AA88APE8_FICCA|nr:hypothetical protein TIFTF001_024046 [Ficus carica]